jgi:hypothetical protein
MEVFDSGEIYRGRTHFGLAAERSSATESARMGTRQGDYPDHGFLCGTLYGTDARII